MKIGTAINMGNSVVQKTTDLPVKIGKPINSTCNSVVLKTTDLLGMIEWTGDLQ
jgi:hypothetical protein